MLRAEAAPAACSPAKPRHSRVNDGLRAEKNVPQTARSIPGVEEKPRLHSGLQSKLQV